VANLDNLNTCIGSLGDLQAREHGLRDLWEAESAIAGLVEALNESNVKGGHVVADTEIDICVGPWVRSSIDDAAAVKRPGGTVVRAVFLRDVCAGPQPL